MRNAATVLGIIRDRGSRGLPLEDVYRQLFNPNLYLAAYGKISANAGALTPGATDETADGMSLATIQRIIGLLREERYRWTPVRRVYIEKKRSTKKRPLGIPTWSDKLLQEVIRLILEAYYEPQFSPRSHGFRPGRGCHTALNEIAKTWKGTVWFIEGDIKGCFDDLDHEVLLGILGERIHDGRFLRLVANLLRAGYLEEWRYNRTLSGSPQGGVVSPILANIYLDRLDTYVGNGLIPQHTRGERRKPNPAYRRLIGAQARMRSGSRRDRKQLRQQLKAIPSGDCTDPTYRRLRYVRYADDFLLGFTGPRAEAEAIKQTIGAFLRDTLKLELSDRKTLVTHGRTRSARFLGYDLVVLPDTKRSRRVTDGKTVRSASGNVGLKVPLEVVREKCAPYLRHGKPTRRTELINDDVFTVVALYAREFRGIVEYYRWASNLHRLNRLRWVMETSLLQTLARKLGISVPQVSRRYKTTIQTERGPKVALQVTIEREGKKPLAATWGSTSLARKTGTVLNDDPRPFQNLRTEIVDRLLADACELCGSHHRVQVHHIKALKDLRHDGRAPKPTWIRTMAARQRKKLVVCRECHVAIHAGRPTRTHGHQHRALESRVP
jgi:group II intron reverse transcriptase/maturase